MESEIEWIFYLGPPATLRAPRFTIPSRLPIRRAGHGCCLRSSRQRTVRKAVNRVV